MIVTLIEYLVMIDGMLNTLGWGLDWIAKTGDRGCHRRVVRYR
jgi:hypothetical protein